MVILIFMYNSYIIDKLLKKTFDIEFIDQIQPIQYNTTKTTKEIRKQTSKS